MANTEERIQKLEEALTVIAKQNEAILQMANEKAKETAPAAVITQEPKEEKKDEIPEWFKAYVANNPPAVVTQPQQNDSKDAKPKKNWKETTKDVLAVAGVGALALFGITKVFNAGQTYEQHQQNLRLLQQNDNPYGGGTIETTATADDFDFTK